MKGPLLDLAHVLVFNVVFWMKRDILFTYLLFETECIGVNTCSKQMFAEYLVVLNVLSPA
jgi:hypothetical protein